MSISRRWAMFQENNPIIAAYLVVTIMIAFAMGVIFVFTHGQGQELLIKHTKATACIHVYGSYDEERDLCLVRD